MLNKILQQPKIARRRIAFAITGVVGLIIISLWLIVVSYEMKGSEDKKAKLTPAENFRQSLPKIKEENNQENLDQQSKIEPETIFKKSGKIIKIQ